MKGIFLLLATLFAVGVLSGCVQSDGSSEPAKSATASVENQEASLPEASTLETSVPESSDPPVSETESVINTIETVKMLTDKFLSNSNAELLEKLQGDLIQGVAVGTGLGHFNWYGDFSSLLADDAIYWIEDSQNLRAFITVYVRDENLELNFGPQGPYHSLSYAVTYRIEENTNIQEIQPEEVSFVFKTLCDYGFRLIFSPQKGEIHLEGQRQDGTATDIGVMCQYTPDSQSAFENYTRTASTEIWDEVTGVFVEELESFIPEYDHAALGWPSFADRSWDELFYNSGEFYYNENGQYFCQVYGTTLYWDRDTANWYYLNNEMNRCYRWNQTNYYVTGLDFSWAYDIEVTGTWYYIDSRGVRLSNPPDDYLAYVDAEVQRFREEYFEQDIAMWTEHFLYNVYQNDAGEWVCEAPYGSWTYDPYDGKQGSWWGYVDFYQLYDGQYELYTPEVYVKVDNFAGEIRFLNKEGEKLGFLPDLVGFVDSQTPEMQHEEVPTYNAY